MINFGITSMARQWKYTVDKGNRGAPVSINPARCLCVRGWGGQVMVGARQAGKKERKNAKEGVQCV